MPSLNEIHPEDRERIHAVFRRKVETGIGERAEFRFLLNDGSIRHIESHGNVVHDASGKVSKVVVVSRDVRCAPGRAKRRRVVPGRRRRGRMAGVAWGREVPNQRRAYASASVTPSSHLRECCVASVERAMVWRSGTDAGRPGRRGIIGCRDKRGRNGDLDVPFRILSVTTLLPRIIAMLV